jgi:hypothetical protein
MSEVNNDRGSHRGKQSSGLSLSCPQSHCGSHWVSPEGKKTETSPTPCPTHQEAGKNETQKHSLDTPRTAWYLSPPPHTQVQCVTLHPHPILHTAEISVRSPGRVRIIKDLDSGSSPNVKSWMTLSKALNVSALQVPIWKVWGWMRWRVADTHINGYQAGNENDTATKYDNKEHQRQEVTCLVQSWHPTCLQIF